MTTAYFAGKNLPGDFHIQRCRLRLSGLDRWAGAGAPGWIGRLKLEPVIGVSYEAPIPIVARIDSNFSIKLQYSIRSSVGRHGLTASEHASFVGEWTEGVDKDAGTRSMVVSLSQLLTLLSNQKARVQEVCLYTLDEPGSPIQVVSQWVFNRTRDRSRRAANRPDFLLRLTDVDNRLEELIRKWYDLQASHSAFIGALFGFIVAPPAFAEQKFLLMMQVMRLAVLAHSQQTPEKTSLTGAEATGWLLGKLSEKIEGAFASLPDTFLSELSVAEADVAAGRHVPGVTLVWFTETTKWLAKTYLLFSVTPMQERLGDLLGKNEEMRFAFDRLGHQA